MSNEPLIIRREQMRVFEDEALREWLANYLTGSYPDRVASMGAAAVRKFVDQGLDSARERSIRNPAAIRKYVHVMFLLGPGLVSDPELAWARKILNNRQFRSDLTRLRVLEDEAIRFLTRTRKTAHA
jgi:hypothetical protein